jgi:Domain of unknown function (DUF4872)/Butirosin biosynthesis protein H, N-terminal
MTQHKHLKQLIRTRMEKTGERYAAARRQIIGQITPTVHDNSDPTLNSPIRWHLPGSIPATTALRILLTHAGVRAPDTQQPLSEAMLFGIAGGIGIGVFSFYYAKEDIATFFIGGRHAWHDDSAYLNNAIQRLGASASMEEAGATKRAEQRLIAAIAEHGPCVVWVDLAGLPHRAVPDRMIGSGYHVITVYAIDHLAGTALIGDLTDEPISIPLPALAHARTRIKKDRQRILSITDTGTLPTLHELVHAGLEACHTQLLHPTLPGSLGNARLAVLETWADRLHGSKGRESWERIFQPGPNLLRGLCAIYDFIEHYGTGGGLCRPIFSEFLAEAATALNQPALAALAEQYRVLGAAWSNLADAALPDDIALLHNAKSLLARKAELIHAGGPQPELAAVWQELGQLEQQAHDSFPISAASASELRVGLRTQILDIYQQEHAAHTAIAQFLEHSP